MEEAIRGSCNRNKNNKSFLVSKGKKEDVYHVLYKVPYGDSPYVRAKHAQLVEKDPEAAIALFWKAINAGDKVDSALKDMAVVMKQLDRSEEAIEAICSFRGLCSKQSQESLDNVLIDLYKLALEVPSGIERQRLYSKFNFFPAKLNTTIKKKRLAPIKLDFGLSLLRECEESPTKCGKIDEQIELLKRKLKLIYQGEAFNGKLTKTARSHGKKFQVSIKQETSRLLGNLGWAYMQKKNYMMAEVVYGKAQMIEPDCNKACNLGLCLIRQARYEEAQLIIENILKGELPGSNDSKSRKRAQELLAELRSLLPPPYPLDLLVMDDEFIKGLEQLMNEWGPVRSKRLPVFEEISSFRDQLAC